MEKIIGILIFIGAFLMVTSGGIVVIIDGIKDINKYRIKNDSEWLGYGIMSIVGGICLLILGVICILMMFVI